MAIYEDVFVGLKDFDFDIKKDWYSLPLIESFGFPRTEEQNRRYGESIRKARKTSKAYTKYDANRPESHGKHIGDSLRKLSERPIVKEIKRLNGPTKRRKIKLKQGWYAMSECKLIPILRLLQQ